MIPATITSGIIPVDIRAIFQEKIKAIAIPLMRLEMLWIVTVMKFVVRPLILLQPKDSLALRLPALFFEISNQGTGILNIFA